MDVEWLEDYLLLLDAGSFSKAAEQRDLSQPAFSRRIMALENWVGAPLLVRGSHKLTATAAGERFRALSEELLRRMYSGRAEVREIGASSRTELRFACTPALSLAYFLPWLKDVEADKPMHSMVLSVDTMTACERQLVQGGVHFVLCHHHKDIKTPLDTPQFQFVPLDEDPLVPLSAPNPDGSPQFPLTGQAKAPIKFLNYTHESGLWRIIEGVRQQNLIQAPLEQVFASHSSMVLAAMARDGRGVAWVPRIFAAADVASGRLVPAGDASWEIAADIRLIRPRARQSEAAERFWGAVLKRYSA